MHDAGVVCNAQTVADLSCNVDGSRDGQRAFAMEQAAAGLTFEVFEDQVVSSFGRVSEIQHGSDIRMLEPAGGPRFTLETLDDLAIGFLLRRDEFHRDSPGGMAMTSFIDSPHSSL